MEVTDAQRRDAISGLPQQAAYRFLIEDLEDSCESLVAAMTQAKTDEELLRQTRLWQVMFKVLGFLRDHPENLKAVIEQELVDIGEEASQYENALSPERALVLRLIEQAQSRVKKRT